MRLTLAARIGPDTLGKLEQAARRRYAEASRLVTDEPLGAVYLFGYTVEIRLKVAYFRTVGLVPASALAASRVVAEAQIRTLLGVRGAVGHSLYGWGRLLETARATTPGANALASGLAREMYKHLQNVEACWTEVLSYRANKPYDDEVEVVRSAAAWFKVNGRRLWS